MNEWTEFTFHDTGKVVKIRKVSPMLAIDIDASIPRPAPPTNRVDYGPPKGVVDEPNYNDPGYLAAVRERDARVGIAATRATILRGVTVEGDEWKKDVEEYRQFILETTGANLEEKNDLILYVLRVCVGSQEDMTDLITAITQRSQPTREGIERAKASFPGQV